MKRFIEKSINENIEELKKGIITLKDIADECVNLSSKYSKYRFGESFDEDIFYSRYYENECRIKDNYRKLEGMPIGVKDVFNTNDYPTQMGSVLWKNFEAGNDARIVSNIIYNGGIMAGKTVTAEFAVHALNDTLNPYDIEKTPGTSSSGSAVAVALGVVPVALATQTAGSIIRPASFCGVYGYKPSFGLIPRTGVLKTTDSLDTIGFITSNIDNVKLMLDVIRVDGLDYPFVYKAFSDKARQFKSNRKWKLGFAKTYTWNNADKNVQEAIINWVANLSKDEDIEIDEIDINCIINGAHDIHSIIYDKSLSYYFQNEHNHKDNVSIIMNAMIEHGEKISPKEYFEALELQNEMCNKMDNFMLDYDAIISLSTASVAPDRNFIEKPDPSLIWNLVHLCSINIPQFHNYEQNLPFGVQMSGRRYNDLLFLSLLDYLSVKGYIPRHTSTNVGENL